MRPDLQVSVVIPTIGRASVRTAVESALHQTAPPMEVIVVLDRDCAPDLPDSAAVRVVRTPGGVGPSMAKHLGIESAHGNVIALLDDDDVWRSDKLEIQLAAVPSGDEWLISSRFRVLAEGREPVVGPRTLITPHEPVAPYLFEFRSRHAFNMITTPSMLFPRALAQTVPMSVAAGAAHDDPTWLIQLRRAFPNLPIIQVPEPLVDINWSPLSVSRSGTDRSAALIAWGMSELADESKRVRGDYMLTSPVGSALAAGSLGGVIRSITAAVRFGRPGLLAWASVTKSLLRLGLGKLKNLATGLTGRH